MNAYDTPRMLTISGDELCIRVADHEVEAHPEIPEALGECLCIYDPFRRAWIYRGDVRKTNDVIHLLTERFHFEQV